MDITLTAVEARQLVVKLKAAKGERDRQAKRLHVTRMQIFHAILACGETVELLVPEDCRVFCLEALRNDGYQVTERERAGSFIQVQVSW
jgi:hypothetical protein